MLPTLIGTQPIIIERHCKNASSQCAALLSHKCVLHGVLSPSADISDNFGGSDQESLPLIDSKMFESIRVGLASKKARKISGWMLYLHKV